MKTRELDMISAAYMYSTLKYPQEAIASTLQISQSVVSRRLKEAREQGWLIESLPQFATDRAQDLDIMSAIEARIYSEELRNTLKKVASENNPQIKFDVRVFPSVNRTSVESFAKFASEYVYSLVAKSHIVGISWGYTLHHLIQAMREHCHAPVKEPIKFFPLSGEPLGNAVTQVSASFLASQLDQMINGKESRDTYSLAGIPALIPMTFPKEKLEAIYDFIDLAVSYNRIFGFRDNGSHTGEHLLEGEPLIDNVDTIITSIGSSDTTFSHNDDGLIKVGRIKRRDLRDTLIGDMSGVPIPRNNLNNKGKNTVSSLVNHWTGIKEEHIKFCAENASDKKSVGVIAIGIGEVKAEVMHECIARGFVNHAVLDNDLADALIRLNK